MKREIPPWLPIALASVALVVSGLSWWESHRGRVINEAVNRPVLSVTKALIRQATYGDERVEAFLFIRLRNEGKTAALLTQGATEPVLMFAPCDLQLLEPAAFAGEILPGQEREFYSRLSLKATPPCNQWGLAFDLTVKVSYRDSGSGAEYSQTFHSDIDLRILDRVPIPTPSPTPR